MVKKKDEIINIDESKVRKIFDEKSGQNYYSIVDIVSILTESSDPRNYWKVLKNRLKNTQKELVTKCNQLKLPSNDGKSYLADVADSKTILEIIDTISPINKETFSKWLDRNEEKFSTVKKLFDESLNKDEEEIGTLQVDGYEIDNDIFIRAFIAGITSNNISISFTCNEVTIRGVREQKDELSGSEIFCKELYFGHFTRTIMLPEEIDIDKVEAISSHGMLTIKLPKKNKFLEKKVEIKFL